MKRSLFLLLLISPCAFAEYHPPIEYGVATTIDFPLYNTDGTLDVDEVDSGTEVTIDCDGTPTTATNDFADEGAFYSIALTAAETQCARVTLTIAATDTNVVVIPTFGNASAQVNYGVEQTGDSYARLGAPAGASVSADIAAAKTDTAAIKAKTDNLTFTTSNEVDVNVHSWNDSAVTAGLITSRDVGVEFSGTVSTVNSQTDLDLSGGATNDSAYDGYAACFVGGTEENCVAITAYTASGNNITLAATPAFTIQTSDTIIIRRPSFATVSGTVSANVVAISGDSTAADNAESFYDGTGYAGTNNIIPVVTNVTGGINTAAGTITTLDALDTAQDTQHGTTQTAISNLNDPSATAVRDAVMQYTLDNGITFEEAQCHMLAVLLGEAAFTAGSPDQAVFDDPTGTDTRVTIQYGTDDGDRTSVTLDATNCGSN